MTTAVPPARAPRPDSRDPYVDAVRAASLILIVVWHWACTILLWDPVTGPTAVNPAAYTPGFWLTTWLFQASPLIFYVGGFAHLSAWDRARSQGVGLGLFVAGRLRRIGIPGASVLLAWLAIGAVATSYLDLTWMARVVRLVISPLWFLGVYVGLIALLPLALWLHRRFGLLTLAILAGVAACVDLARFGLGLDRVAWVNMLVVWAFAHQAGFSHRRLAAASGHLHRGLLACGLGALVGLVASGLYPRAMIGIYGERFSNMAPPTFAIVALTVLQVGLVLVLRPVAERVLAFPVVRRVSRTINGAALPIFLLHPTSMAVAVAVAVLLFHRQLGDPVPPDPQWWLGRPWVVLGALACTVPMVWLYRRGLNGSSSIRTYEWR